MANCTRDSGISVQEIETELGFSSGLMAPNMKDCGGTTKPMAGAG